MILSGGGTAGHIYPALALASELRTRGHEVLFVGTPSSMEERLAEDAGLPFEALDVRPLEQNYRIWRGPQRARYTTLITSPLSWWRARIPARAILRTFRPDVVVGFGGYVCVPMVRAAQQAGVATVLHEQNAVLGKANRQLARRATMLALTYETTVSEAHAVVGVDKVTVTGNPVRPEVEKADRAQARAMLGLRESNTMVLVFGGSGGARRLSEAFVRIYPQVEAATAAGATAVAEVAVFHATGTRDYAHIADLLAAQHCPPDTRADTLGRPARYTIEPYFDDMPVKLAAADLVVSRAGSTSVAEFMARALPAVLVPFPHATADHQTKNAQALVDAGAAVLVRDDELDSRWFGEVVAELAHDPDRRAEMSRAYATLSTANAREALADLVVGVRKHV